jgi:hypothetical protein
MKIYGNGRKAIMSKKRKFNKLVEMINERMDLYDYLDRLSKEYKYFDDFMYDDLIADINDSFFKAFPEWKKKHKKFKSYLESDKWDLFKVAFPANYIPFELIDSKVSRFNQDDKYPMLEYIKESVKVRLIPEINPEFPPNSVSITPKELFYASCIIPVLDFMSNYYNGLTNDEYSDFLEYLLIPLLNRFYGLNKYKSGEYIDIEKMNKKLNGNRSNLKYSILYLTGGSSYSLHSVHNSIYTNTRLFVIKEPILSSMIEKVL